MMSSLSKSTSKYIICLRFITSDTDCFKSAFEDEGHTAHDVKSSEMKAHDPETVHPAEDIDARLQQLSRKYTLLLENFEHQFTGFDY